LHHHLPQQQQQQQPQPQQQHSLPHPPAAQHGLQQSGATGMSLLAAAAATVHAEDAVVSG
jgi:hypothetical protein